jgi:hypothetical protein
MKQSSAPAATPGSDRETAFSARSREVVTSPPKIVSS